MNSIRRRLLWWQTGAVAVAAILVSIVSYQLAWNGFNHVRDFTLETLATSILQYGVEPVGTPDNVQFVSQIWDPAGRLKFSSRPAIALPLQSPGLHSLQWQGEAWHVYTLQSPEATVQVANTEANRLLMFKAVSHWLLVPISLLVAVLGAMLWVATGNVLRPLATVQREIEGNDIAHLQTIPVVDYPVEIVPLVDALNKLLARLDRSLITQRHFVADAAHELRTPLTAIKLHAQIIQKSGVDPARQETLAILLGSVDRATRLVEQLLQLARLDPEANATRDRRRVAFDDLVQQTVAEFSGFAAKQGATLCLERCDPVDIPGHADDLRAMLGNLIDNALRYGRPGNRVTVQLRADDTHVDLRVTDTGPGIPDTDKVLAFERFHRLADAEISGSGLGLAIVRQVIDSHDGRIELTDTPGGGLCVSVVLPVPPEPEFTLRT